MKQKKAVSSQKNNRSWKLAKLALILGCSLAAASFAPHAHAADYHIDGSTGNTLADVLLAVSPGDTIFVNGDQSTNFSNRFNSFNLKSENNAPVTITANEGNCFAQNNITAWTIIGDKNVTFKGGTAFGTSANGGAINRTGQPGQWLQAGNINISGVNFDSNSATGGTASNKNCGGAFYQVFGQKIEFNDISFTNNTAGYQGGAIFVNSMYGTDGMTIEDSSFINNKSEGGAGGAIYFGVNYNGTSQGPNNLSLTNVLFEDNEGTRGGAIYSDSSDNQLFIQDSTFKNNKTTTDASPQFGIGGGAILSHGKGSMTGTNLFEGNYAVNGGGALSLMDEWEIDGNTSFVNNTTDGEGGAIYAAHEAMLMISGNVNFTDNSATGNGGAISVDRSTIKLNPTAGNTVTFSGNTANGDPNSIYFGSDAEYAHSFLYIEPEEGGTVSLLDPIKVNQTGDSNMFVMDINAAGSVILGGKNEITTTGYASYSEITFNAGNITFNNDFTLVNQDGIMNVNLHNPTITKLNVILDGRDETLPLFQNASYFSVDDNITLNIASTFEDQTFILSDTAEDDENLGKLIIVGNTGEAVVTTEGNKTIVTYKSKAQEKLTSSKDPNIGKAAPAMVQIFQTEVVRMEQDEEISVEQADQIFTDIVDNGQTYTAEGALSQAFGAFDQSNRVYQKAMQLNQSGEQFTAAPNTGSTLRGQCGESCQTCCTSITRTWGGYLGADASLDSDGYGGFSQSWNGIVGGISKDYQNGNLGTWFSWAGGRNNLDQLNTKIENDAYNFGLFATVHPYDDVNLTLDVNYGHYTNDMYRNNATGFYSGSFDQNTYGTGIFLSKDYCRSNGIFTPYLGARYTYLNQSGYDESGVAVVDYANSLNGFNATSLQSWLGASFSKGFQGANCWIWTPTLFGAWRHEYMDNQFSTTGSYNAIPGQQFLLSSVARDRDMADLGFSVSASSNQISIGAGYNATLTNNFTDHNWFAGMSYRY